MKKSITVLVLIMLVVFAGCTRAGTSEDVNFEKPVAEYTTIIESTTEKGITELETTRKSDNLETTAATTRPADQKSSGQTTTKKSTATQNQTTTKKQTSVQSQTTTRKVTTTQKQNVTQKQTTTKKVTTTVTTTAKQNKLSKSDVDWVQSQAHSYIKSKGMSVNSSVESFSYRTSSGNYTDRNKLLSNIKDTIDYEYSECMSSGWKNVDMYVSVTSDGDEDYWLVVMYG